MSHEMLALLVVVSVPWLLIVPPAVVCLVETRPVWPYVPADELAWKPAPLRRAAEKEAAALAGRGFAHLATLYDGKGSAYRLRYDFWLSADRRVLALVGGGRLFGVPMGSTVWLYSRLADGRGTVSVNDPGGREPDLAGVWDDRLFPEPDAAALFDKHADRLAADRAEVVPYSADPLADHAALLRRQADLLVDRGYAVYTDDDRTAWRYTPKGALVVSVRGIWVLFRGK